MTNDEDNLMVKSPVQKVVLGPYTTPTNTMIVTQSNPVIDANNFLLQAIEESVDKGVYNSTKVYMFECMVK